MQRKPLCEARADCQCSVRLSLLFLLGWREGHAACVCCSRVNMFLIGGGGHVISVIHAQTISTPISRHDDLFLTLCVFWLYGVCISVTENWPWNGIQTRTLRTRMRQRKDSKSCQRRMKFSQTVRLQNKKLVYLKCTVWNELYWSHYCLRCEACAIKKQWHFAPVV